MIKKYRIHEIAKMVGVESKKLLADAQKVGFQQLTAISSSLDEYQMRDLFERLNIRLPGEKNPEPTTPVDSEETPKTPTPSDGSPGLDLEARKVFNEDREGTKVTDQRIRSTVIRRRRFEPVVEAVAAAAVAKAEAYHVHVEQEVTSSQVEDLPEPSVEELSPAVQPETEVLEAPFQSPAFEAGEPELTTLEPKTLPVETPIVEEVGPEGEPVKEDGREIRIKGKKGDFTYTFQHLKVVERPAYMDAPPEEPKKPVAKKTEESPAEQPAPATVVDPTTVRKEKRGEEDDRPSRRRAAKRNVIIERDFLEEIDGGREFGPGGRRRKKKEFKKTEVTVPKAIKRKIRIDETIQVGELAKRLGIKVGEIIAKLLSLGTMATVNQCIDLDTAMLVAQEYNYEVANIAVNEESLLQSGTTPTEVEDRDKTPRPPVVTVMGHVDHGKTSILDVIRKARVAEGEAGGITQHIGAYVAEVSGQPITFIDTPGHAAFTSMRAHGAQVTDIVVLVTAADDGVMPQTIEALKHAQAAKVPIIVAINKMDLPQANPDRIRQQLSEHGLIPEEWGGETLFVEVSARERTNIDKLLESILLQAEILELHASLDVPGQAVVIESRLDKSKGQVINAIVQQGQLKVGDFLVCGSVCGKIKALSDDRGRKISSAGPSRPIEILGLSGVGNVGDTISVVKDEKIGKQLVDLRKDKEQAREQASAAPVKVTLDGLFQQIQDDKLKELNIIVKGDTNGTAEALKDAMLRLSNETVKINVIHHAAGGITGNDVMMAAAFSAIIIGFNVRPDNRAQALAGEQGVDIKLFSIIYEALDTVAKALRGMIEPVLKEEYLGKAEVRQLFTVPKIGTIAGAYILDGKILRNSSVRVIRDNVVLFDGKLKSLRRFKDDVKEVSSGYECGIGVENYNDLKEGDLIESYQIKEVRADVETR